MSLRLERRYTEIDTDKTEFNAEVGEISIGDFSSGTGNLEANFQELTGINPSTIPVGIPIPGGVHLNLLILMLEIILIF